MQWHSTLEQAKAYGARSKALAERGEKPSHRAVMLIHGDVATQAMAHSGRAMHDGRLVPIEVLARNATRASA